MYICTMRSTSGSSVWRSLACGAKPTWCDISTTLWCAFNFARMPDASKKLCANGSVSSAFARTDQDQAGRIWPVRAATREQARQKAPRNDLFSGVYAVLHTQSEGQLQGRDAHREVTLAGQPNVIVRSDAANTTPADPGTGRRAQSHPPRGLRLLWCRRQHPRAAEGARVCRALLAQDAV